MGTQTFYFSLPRGRQWCFTSLRIKIEMIWKTTAHIVLYTPGICLPGKGDKYRHRLCPPPPLTPICSSARCIPTMPQSLSTTGIFDRVVAAAVVCSSRTRLLLPKRPQTSLPTNSLEAKRDMASLYKQPAPTICGFAMSPRYLPAPRTTGLSGAALACPRRCVA